MDGIISGMRADTEAIIAQLQARRAELVNDNDSMRALIAQNVTTLREIESTLADARGFLAALNPG